MTTDYLSEKVYNAVNAIYAASGNNRWLDIWESAIPLAVSELRRNVNSLSGDTLVFAQQVLDLIARHEPAQPTAERGTIGAALEAMSEEDLSEFKSALWRLNERLSP